ncbi:MAG: NUDIX hydrolase [Crocinitomicaceae bacterium]
MSKKFNIRVYGLLFNSKKEVLIAHEERASMSMTKFPGGGLEWGEGIQDALIREFQEELNLEIEVKKLFYLTDYFQVSAFSKDDQLISVYYKVSEIGNKLPQAKQFIIGDIKFEWVRIDELHAYTFTFPIDQLVAKKLAD